MNYIKIKSLIEKINRDKPDSFKLYTSDVLEWIWEAVRAIGAERFYIIDKVHVKVEDFMCVIPEYVVDIKSIYTSKGYPMIETRSRFEDTVLNNPQYYINGRNIVINSNDVELIIESKQYPVDINGNPLIPDNYTVIEAITSFVLFKLAKREWLRNDFSEAKYRAFEQDWLFNVGAAHTKLMIPTEDEMRGFAELHDISPGLNKELIQRKEEVPLLAVTPYV